MLSVIFFFVTVVIQCMYFVSVIGYLCKLVGFWYSSHIQPVNALRRICILSLLHWLDLSANLSIFLRCKYHKDVLK